VSSNPRPARTARSSGSSHAPAERSAISRPAAKQDFAPTFAALRDILRKYERHLVVKGDGPAVYMLATRARTRTGTEIYFGGARIGKAYVSFHLFSVYACPDLLAGVPKELLARMQGKSCFNFKTVDAGQLRMLEAITRAGFERFRKEGMLEEIVWDPRG
jgi:hypothetical protein